MSQLIETLVATGDLAIALAAGGAYGIGIPDIRKSLTLALPAGAVLVALAGTLFGFESGFWLALGLSLGYALALIWRLASIERVQVVKEKPQGFYWTTPQYLRWSRQRDK